MSDEQINMSDGELRESIKRRIELRERWAEKLGEKKSIEIQIDDLDSEGRILDKKIANAMQARGIKSLICDDTSVSCEKRLGHCDPEIYYSENYRV